MKQSDFPAHHPRDYMLIAWAHFHDKWWPLGCNHGLDIDSNGIPILTPELRKSLGDEWYNWRKAQ